MYKEKFNLTKFATHNFQIIFLHELHLRWIHYPYFWHLNLDFYFWISRVWNIYSSQRSMWVGKLFQCLILELNFSYGGNISETLCMFEFVSQMCLDSMLELNPVIHYSSFSSCIFIETSVKSMNWKVAIGGTRALTCTLSGSGYQVTSTNTLLTSAAHHKHNFDIPHNELLEVPTSLHW